MTDDPIRQAAHDLHDHIHALEMGLLALSATDSQPARTKLSESLQHELRCAKGAAQRLVHEATATNKNAD